MTTHRLVWGDTVINLDDIKSFAFVADDKWKVALISAGISIVLLLFSQTWAKIASIAFFCLAIAMIYFKNDMVVFTLESGQRIPLSVKRDRAKFRRIEDAFRKQRSMIVQENREIRKEEASMSLDEIDRLPEVGT